jgi:FtsP/CotA-like multicopper oxidase with cupredoxin domain
MMNRRQLLKVGAVLGVGASVPIAASRAFASVRVPQTPLPAKSIPKFVDPVPTFVGARVPGTSLVVSMHEFQQKVLPESAYARLPAPFNDGTFVWGYKVGNRSPHYPGYTIEARRRVAMHVTYVNNLPLPGDSMLAPRLTIDQTIHWADPLHQMTTTPPFTGPTTPYTGPIPTVVHLHGGMDPSEFDGNPEGWFTPNGLHGPAYGTFAPTAPNAVVYRYPNYQPATTLWVHDHALGITRINIFAGLAAFYFVRDKYDSGLPNNPLGLPAGYQEIELMFQDREFDTDGQLLWPDGTPAAHPTGLVGPPPNPSVHPFWISEFFGGAIVVNGKSWPYLNVEPRRYRFRIVNGSNARFFTMRLVDAASQAPGPAFWQIGTDGGLLDRPVQLNDPHDPAALRLLLGPAERADIIIDFAGLAGRSFTLVNNAAAPYPDGVAPDPATNGQLMQFRVHLPLSGRDTTYNPANGAPLRGGRNQDNAIVRLANPATGAVAVGVTPSVSRQLVLIEVDRQGMGIEADGSGGPIEVLLNNTKWDGMREGTTTPVPGSQANPLSADYVTELPRVGSTEVWEFINLTTDAHPIHIHLVQVQLINRQAAHVASYQAAYSALFPGGRYIGITPTGTWGLVTYPPGVYIPGYGPPLPYNTPNAGGALGGNPDIGPYLQNRPTLPDPNEAGWKDTIKVHPGMVTRFIARFAPLPPPVAGVKPGQNRFAFDPTIGPGYIWHCHILDHEDNEMMRSYVLRR